MMKGKVYFGVNSSKYNKRRGRAFASLSRNSSLQSSFANALPSLLSSISYPCGLRIVGEWRSLREVWDCR
jgi:hypothetical protein